MKEFRFRIILILAAMGISLYLLYPTFADYQNSKEISAKLSTVKDSIKKATPQITDEELQALINLKEEAIISNNLPVIVNIFSNIEINP